jgi:cytochrome P450
MRLGPYHDFTVFHPKQIHEVLVEKAKDFVRMGRPLRVLSQWNGAGILITEGETWLRQRRILQPAFQRARLARYAQEVTAAAGATLDRLEREPGPADFEQAMYDLTTAVICRTMFGTDLGDDRREVRRAVQILGDVALREMLAPFTWPDWLPLPGKAAKRWAIRTIDGTARRFIRERRAAGGDQGDLLSMLLLAVDEEGDRKGLSDEQARDNCVTIFLAGHDTTAAGLTWVGWALATHPEIARQATAEVDAVLGGRAPTSADLPRLPLVERVVKETLRHYPPAVAVFARQAAREVEVGGWVIPRGGLVRVLTYVTHHDPRWYPDPDRFDPERFAPGRIEQIPPGAYLPFGLGPRTCIGNQFALMEMTLVTAMLLQRLTLSPARGQQEPSLHPGMSLRPVGGMPLELKPRHPHGGGAVV